MKCKRNNKRSVESSEADFSALLFGVLAFLGTFWLVVSYII